jgi:hypothetical protein
MARLVTGDPLRSSRNLQRPSRLALPLMVGGDFNLIRGFRDKNNSNINCPRVYSFNDCIANLELREIRRTGARYTWSNKQLNPVRCVLDRVFMSTDWETLFPCAPWWQRPLLVRITLPSS